MTQLTETSPLPGLAERNRETRIIGLVGGAHFVSHLQMLLLPPLFVFIRAEYGVSYAELGFAIAVFNIVSMVLQAPAGFIVDRLGPTALLIAALVLGGTGLVIAGAVPFYWALVAGWAVAGVANTLYHPADYAILSQRIGGRRIGQAFSLHTFFGMLGTAVAPVSMLFLARLSNWHGALLGAAALAYIMALVLILQRRTLEHGAAPAAPRAAAPEESAGWALLLSAPILRNMLFFMLLSCASIGISNFSIVALGALDGTALPVANLALSVFLGANAVGVLAGGYIADRTRRHDRVAMAGFAASGAAVLVIGMVALGTAALVLAMAAAGFLNGLILPSRDMMVRAMTPKGAFGKVFGFVSTGFSIGGVISPLLFGWVMDQGEPRAVFLLVVAFTLLALPLISLQKPAR